MDGARDEDVADPQAHGRACAVLRAAIKRAQRVILGEPAKDDSPGCHSWSEEEFLVEVRRWLSAVRDASRKGWDANDAWHTAFRHYLACIVGPRARTELGKAAGQCGYRMLAIEFSVLFGRPVSTHPMICEHGHHNAARDADLVAMFCAFPPRMQRDPGFVSRLLALAARLAGTEPRAPDDETCGHLAELQRVYSATPSTGIGDSDASVAR